MKTVALRDLSRGDRFSTDNDPDVPYGAEVDHTISLPAETLVMDPNGHLLMSGPADRTVNIDFRVVAQVKKFGNKMYPKIDRRTGRPQTASAMHDELKVELTKCLAKHDAVAVTSYKFEYNDGIRTEAEVAYLMVRALTPASAVPESLVAMVRQSWEDHRLGKVQSPLEAVVAE